MTIDMQRIAIVTGANGGVGYGICQRLIEADRHVKLIMACRNFGKAAKARESLLNQYPYADIEIETVDVGSAKSIFNFCAAIQNKYTYINFIFCNAGILDSTGINWKKTIYMLLVDTVALMEQADATIQVTGEINADGMGKIFATNVFGHYIIMRELEALLSNSGEGRVLWTSSITAKANFFDIEDWQGVKTDLPYESSKWAGDLISIASSERFKKEEKNITSFTTSPGVVATDIGALPRWIILARLLLHYIMRLCGVISQTISPYNGAFADVYAAFQPLEDMNYLYRYNSVSTRLGKAYVEITPVEDYDPEIAKQLISKCELSYQSFKKIYKTEAPVNQESVL